MKIIEQEFIKTFNLLYCIQNLNIVKLIFSTTPQSILLHWKKMYLVYTKYFQALKMIQMILLPKKENQNIFKMFSSMLAHL